MLVAPVLGGLTQEDSEFHLEAILGYAVKSYHQPCPQNQPNGSEKLERKVSIDTSKDARPPGRSCAV